MVFSPKREPQNGELRREDTLIIIDFTDPRAESLGFKVSLGKGEEVADVGSFFFFF